MFFCDILKSMQRILAWSLSLIGLWGCGADPWQILLNQAFKPEQACGFVQNGWGQRVSWNGQIPVRIYLHSSIPDPWRPAILKAVQKWNQNPFQRAVLDLANERRSSEAFGDGINIIGLRTSWNSNSSSQQAKTLLKFFGDQIIEADVWINGQHYQYALEDPIPPDRIDLQSLLIHELGHVLGLSHNSDMGSVMYPYLARGQIRRSIAPSDFQNLACEYP